MWFRFLSDKSFRFVYKVKVNGFLDLDCFNVLAEGAWQIVIGVEYLISRVEGINCS